MIPKRHTTNRKRTRNNRSPAPLISAAAACIAAAVLASCTIPQFPHIQPMRKQPPEWLAKRRAEEYFMKGRECERSGLSQMALRLYEMAHELDPEARTLRDMLVQRYIFSSHFSQAVLCIRGNRKDSEMPDADKSLCAGIYMRMGQFARAAELLESVTVKGKEETYTLGLIYESLGNIPKALSCYRDYISRNPSSLELVLKTGSLYARMRQYDAAESLYADAGRNNGRNPRLFNAIGEVKLAKGDTALAVDFFKMSVMIDSGYLEGVRNMAQVSIQKGEYATAIPLYEKLYAVDSAGDVFGKTLALLYYYGNQVEKSKALLRKLLSSDIEDHELHFYLGLAYSAQDSCDLAGVEYNKTLAIRDDYSGAWLQLCYCAIKRKEYDAALATARKFLKVQPQNGAAVRTVGYVYNVRKDYARATDFLNKAVGMDSTDAFAWFELGSALERTKDRKNAAAAFRRVLALRPGDAAAANYWGYMWAEEGANLDSARALIETALAHDSANGAYLDSYAWVFFQLGATDSALVYIVKAMKQIKDDPVVYSHYGDILLKKGQDAGALEAYRKSLGLDAKSEEAEQVREKIKALELKTGGRGAEKPLPKQ